MTLGLRRISHKKAYIEGKYGYLNYMSKLNISVLTPKDGKKATLERFVGLLSETHQKILTSTNQSESNKEPIRKLNKYK